MFLNAAHYLGIAKLMGELEIGKSAALQLALNQGLHDFNVLTDEEYLILDARYRRKLKDIIEENRVKRENSHLPKVELEKLKRAEHEKCQQEVVIQLKEKQLRGMWEQWDLHTDLNWRIKVVAEAKKYPDLEYAKKLILKGEQCDIISQGAGTNDR